MKAIERRIETLEKVVLKEDARQNEPNWFEEFGKYVEGIPEVWVRELLCYFDYLTAEALSIAQRRVWPKGVPYNEAFDEANKKIGPYWEKYESPHQLHKK